jgi:tryptophanyl-tRNA synthetase
MAHPERIEEILQQGAEKARAIAGPLLARAREAVGLRRFNAVAAPVVDTAKAAKAALPVFKQYRETDGQFYFKLVSAEGQVLLQSAAFAGGRDAGQWVARLKREGAAALAEAPVQRGEGVDEAALSAALLALQAADAA